MIDSHVHFWHYQVADYPWINEAMTTLCQHRLPEHYPVAVPQSDCTINGFIAVQARCCETENAFLLDLATHDRRICGVVGWLDFCADNLSERLSAYAEVPLMVGYRHLVQDEPKPSAFWSDKAFNLGIASLQQQAITYDVLARQADLLAVISFCKQHDKAPLVIDHLAKPAFGGDDCYQHWREAMAILAKMPHVFVKLSGVALEAGSDAKSERIYPYWADAIELFGAHRCLWGSDWPVSLLGHDYDTLIAFWHSFAKTLSASERQAVEEKSAVTAYDLALS